MKEFLEKSLKISFHAILLVFIILSCSKVSGVKQSSPSPGDNANATSTDTSTSTNTDTASIDTTGASHATNTTSEIADPSQIKVYDLAVENLSQQGNVGFSLSYDVHGASDYVFIRICPMEKTNQTCPSNQDCSVGGQCSDNVSTCNRLDVPPIMSGKLEISVQGCMNKAVNGVHCGDWNQITYESHLVNEQLQALYLEQERLINQFVALVMEDRQALVEFVTDANSCEIQDANVKNAMNVKLRIVEQYISAPADFVEQAAKTAATAILLGQKNYDALNQSLSKWNTIVSKAKDQVCAPSAISWICYITGTLFGVMKGMATAMNPSQSLGILINNIATVVNPGDSVPKQCTAEAVLGKKRDQIQKSISDLQFSLQQNQQSISAASGAGP